jgi:membrane protease YdiL (CAAX protease family)
VNWGYHTLLQELLGADGSYFDELREAGLSTGAMIFSFCVIPAVTEEIAFRGLVQHWLQAAIKPMGALILASALFAGMHFNVISFFYLFAVGMLLGWTRLKSGSLYPAMLIHFLHNLIVIEVMY